MIIKHKSLWETFFPQFIACDDPAMQSLVDSAILVNLSAGQRVFSAGSHCENYLLLLEGSIKAQLISETGREIMLYQVLPGSSCILTTSCLLSGDHYPAEAIAETTISAFAISSHTFYRCLERSSFFREFVFKNFATRLSLVIGRLDEVLFTSIEQRLAQLLLSYQQTEIKITHQALATHLGSVREVISRQLKQFEDKGLVSLYRGTITIDDPDGLKQLNHRYEI